MASRCSPARDGGPSTARGQRSLGWAYGARGEPLDVSHVDPSSLLTLVGQAPDEEELLPVRQRRLDWAALPTAGPTCAPARAPPESEFDFVDVELGAHLID